MAREGVLAPLDGRGPVLFLVGGVLLVVFAGVNIAQALTDPSAYENLHGTFGPAGFTFGFLGLLGLYPTLADRSPKLARIGAVCAALGAAGFAVLAVESAAGLAGVEPPTVLQFFLLPATVGILVGFPAFAAATLRTNARSRTVGLLLLAPTVVFGVMLVGGAVLGGAAWGAAVLSSAQALAYLAIGYTLRADGQAGRAEVTADAAA